MKIFTKPGKNPKRQLLRRVATAASFLLLSASASMGQMMLTDVSSGTSTTPYLPIYGYYGYSYSQQIYLASDFAAPLQGQQSYITKIRFYNVTGSLSNATSWTVYMGNTDSTGFTSNTNWIPLAALQQVFTGTLSAPTSNSWLEITLDTPFLWDGISNVVVGVDENTGGYSSITWGSVNTGSNRSILYRNDTNNPDPASPPSASARYSMVPKAQFVHEAVSACNGPLTHATAVSSISNFCDGDTVSSSLTLSNFSFQSGVSYQWQYNDGSGWQNYAMSDTLMYNAQFGSTTDVRAIATCVATNDVDTSGTTSITMRPYPTVSVNQATVAVFCSTDSVMLVADGADTYSWSPSTGLNTTTNDTVYATPSSGTAYTVIGTTIYGCADTATTADIYPISGVELSSSYTPETICSAGSQVDISTQVSPSNLSGGATWEYKFFDVNGAVLQDWSASSGFSFTPATDSVYTVYYKLRATGCSDDIDSAKVVVTVGFGGVVSTVDYNCNNLGGTIDLSTVFGQPQTDTVYMSPLADSSDLIAATLYGNASVTGGRTVLTPSATSKSGLVMFADPSFHTGFNNAYAISFKMTADQAINTYGTGGADGICYSFGDNLSTTGHQNGSGNKLRLSFDAAGNSPNQMGIYLVYGNTNGVSNTGVTPTGPATLFYTANVSTWKLKTDVQVNFWIDIQGRASMTIDGQPIFTNVMMPAAYRNANTSGWEHSFGAATGGDAMRQAISDLKITSTSVQLALVPTGTTPTNWQDSTSTYTGVQPGVYDLWMSSNGNTSCGRVVKTVEIHNSNPYVDLGADTTICEGETLVLDAGNPGSTYTWSNSQVTTQTNTVSQSGNYVAYVTDAAGCVGIGSIVVDVTPNPSASNVFVQQVGTSVQLSVMNAQNVNNYSWDFGDGTTAANAPASVSHTYPSGGVYSASVTLTNACGTATIFQTVVVNSTASLNENEIAGLKVYPNPANGQFTIELPEAQDAVVTVMDMTGAVVVAPQNLEAQTVLSVQGWAKGVYFVKVTNNNQVSTVRLVVQ